MGGGINAEYMGTHPIFESDFDCLTEMKLLASLLGLGASKLSPFSDDVLYTLDFVGEKANLDVPGIKYDESDFVIMKTPHNEEYKCYLPQDKLDANDEPDEIGAVVEDLLDPLMKVQASNKPQCTPVKLETYWSYELCHGKYIRQYHEEKIKNGVSKTEYFLGYYNGKLPLEKPAVQPKSRKEVKTKMIDGIETPYYEMMFDSGTECSLKQGTHRTARVQYICNPQAHTAEILSITETRTCEYEVQVLTAALCRSPLYSQKIDTDTFGIPCEKIGDKTPVAPMGYRKTQDSPMSITTIDTKTGEIKQITQEELVEILKEAASLGVFIIGFSGHFFTRKFRKTLQLVKSRPTPCRSVLIKFNRF